MPPTRCRGLAPLVLLALLLPACASDSTRGPATAPGEPSVSPPPGEAPATSAQQPARETPTIGEVAERYVKLVLAVGQHDADYVDAYYGPAEWRKDAESTKRPLAALRAEAGELMEIMAAQTPRLWAGPATTLHESELVELRYRYLARQLAALAARVDLLAGKKMTFDEESQALYDAVAPTYPEEHFQKLAAELEHLLPGSGPLPERLEAFRKGFVIPPERVDEVFRAAIEQCRARTLEHIQLPAEESFDVETVRDKPWSAYNWYKGGFHSLIQVNVELPIQIDRAIDLACHEGYPGHHVYNALLEKHLVRSRGWVELSVYPLFSPQSLIAEGTANFGIEVAFPGDERTAFEKRVLYPLAGLDPATADRYAEVQRITGKLDYAGNEAARRYLDGQITADQAADWLVRYALSSPKRARQRVTFFDKYRSYVINYNLGRDLVRAYVEKNGGTEANPARRWKVFANLLSSPRLPSGLR